MAGAATPGKRSVVKGVLVLLLVLPFLLVSACGGIIALLEPTASERAWVFLLSAFFLALAILCLYLGIKELSKPSP